MEQKTKRTFGRYIDNIPKEEMSAHVLEQLMFQNEKLTRIIKNLIFYTALLVISLIVAIIMFMFSL